MVFCFLMHSTICRFRKTNRAPPNPQAILQTERDYLFCPKKKKIQTSVKSKMVGCSFTGELYFKFPELSFKLIWQGWSTSIISQRPYKADSLRSTFIHQNGYCRREDLETPLSLKLNTVKCGVTPEKHTHPRMANAGSSWRSKGKSRRKRVLKRAVMVSGKKKMVLTLLQTEWMAFVIKWLNNKIRQIQKILMLVQQTWSTAQMKS